MTTIAPEAPSPAGPPPTLDAGTLHRSQHVAIVAGAAVVGALSWLPDGTSPNWARWVIVTLLVYCAAIYVASRMIEGPRHAVDRLATAVMTSAFCVVLLPLISVIFTVVQRGWNRMDSTFFTSSMRGVVGEGGGVWHAIVGTLIVTGLATLMSVPFGLFTAIYLVEYGTGRLARAITAMVDVMTGIPSIVAGLFAYALFVIWQGPGARSASPGPWP